MFGEMRRKKQALPLETCENLMQSPSVIFTRSKRFFSTVPEMDIR